MLKKDVIKQENIMVLNTKVSKGIEYLYFQAGKDTLYIGPKDKPEKAKEDNVIRALEHVRERLDHYAESYDELLPFLTTKTRGQYAEKEIIALNDIIAKYGKHRHSRSRK